MVTYLIDTDIVIDLLRMYPPAHAWFAQEKGLGVASVVWIEVLQGASNKHSQQRALLLNALYRIEITTADIDWAITALFSFTLSHGIQGFDALIAAVSHRLDLPLYTRNLKHFYPLIGNLAQAPSY